MKYILSLIMLLNASLVFSHTYVRDASIMNRGTVNPALMDHSSATMVGPTVNGSEIDPNVIYSTTIQNGQVYGEDIAEGTIASTAIVTGSFIQQSSGVIVSTHLANTVEKPSNYYSVVIGTLGSIPGTVDIASNTEDGYNEALRLLNARGLTSSTTGQGQILLLPGVYKYQSLNEVPAGISFYGLEGSSTVIILQQDTGPFFTNYGKMKHIILDFGGFVVGTDAFIASTHSVTNVKVSNTYAITITGGSFGIFTVQNSTDVHLKVEFLGNTLYGAQDQVSGVIVIERSSDVYVTVIAKQAPTITTSGQHFGTIESSKRVFFENSILHGMGGRGLVLNGANQDVVIRNNNFFVSQTYEAVIHIDGASGASNSTNTITGNNFYHSIASDVSPIILLNDGTFETEGTYITDNYLQTNTGNVVTFVSVEASQFGTVLRGNTCNGCTLIGDSGVQTKSSGLGNFNANNEN